MSSPALVLEGLRKRYTRRGPWVLDGLTCRFPRGAVSGLVGPNGAGKTTLFSAVVDFLKLQDGRVDILGEGPFEAFRFKGRIGVLPQDAQLDPRLTPHAFLRGMGQLQGLSRVESEAAVRRALASVNLTERGKDRVGALSHGMRRRISVASALLGQPELVLLDEPTAGLDPREAASLRALLKGLGGKTSVVVSSHNLAELEQICDHVVLIEAGRCLGEGTVEELTARGGVETWSLGPGEL
ncbi:MAG: ABC transporter ATP-binding protein [Myxococcota bacterium]|nr:ABC transporter ATP-binding protein [Myxococcota bacterium]